MIFQAKGWALNSRAMTEQKTSLVTLVSHGCHSTTVTLPTGYLPLPPLHKTFHTIKPVIYIAMVIYFVLRERMKLFCQVLVLFLSSFINDPVLRSRIKKSCSSMSFINLIIFLWIYSLFTNMHIKENICGKRLSGRNGIRYFASPVFFACANHI